MILSEAVFGPPGTEQVPCNKQLSPHSNSVDIQSALHIQSYMTQSYMTKQIPLGMASIALNHSV